MGDKNSRQLKAFHSALVSASPDDLDPNVIQGWIDNPASLGRVLRSALMPEERAEPSYAVWKTLTIGGVSAEELLKRLSDGGFYVSDWARDIMGKPAFTTLAEPVDVPLVRIKVRDLGFKKEPTTSKLFVRAGEEGFDLCPAEVGPHLRLADADQPSDTLYWVVTEPITGRPDIFFVGRNDDGERCLYARSAYPSFRWYLEDGLVLRLRK